MVVYEMTHLRMKNTIRHSVYGVKGGHEQMTQVVPLFYVVDKTQTTSTSSNGNAPILYFTQDQYQQIIKMLNKNSEQIISTYKVVVVACIFTALLSQCVDNNCITDTRATNGICTKSL